ncbi:transposase [Glaesserella parasuis]|uniref:transposase n=1 Tax=Glaesserella parasuis TaxID=738 RepID=UPI003AF83B2D
MNYEPKKCHFCHSSDIRKHGIRNNIQRYKCNACNKTFTLKKKLNPPLSRDLNIRYTDADVPFSYGSYCDESIKKKTSIYSWKRIKIYCIDT